MAVRGTSQQHTTLINELCKACTSEILAELKTLTKAKEFGGLRAGELEKLNNLRDLLEKLEKKRIFKQGNYGKLKELFQKAEFEDGVDCITEYEGGVPMDQHDHNVNNNRSSDVGGLMSQVPPGRHAVTGQAPSYQSSGPAGLSASSMMPPPTMAPPRAPRDQHDASPMVPDLPIYDKGRGYLLLINNFVATGAEKWREGAQIDENNIRSVFEGFIRTFAINLQRDLTKDKLKQVLSNVKEELGRSNYKSFICIICSHGERHEVESGNQKAFKEGFLTVDNQLITEDEVTEHFEGDKVKTMKGCPKVFIFQCCRGRAFGRGVLDRSDSTEVQQAAYSSAPTIDMSDGPKPVSLPTNADMLIAHSTSKGTKAWRNNVDGSWFIKSFCDTLKICHRTDHLLDIMLRVNSAVAERESSEGGAKQMPCQVSTLTKKFMLGE